MRFPHNEPLALHQFRAVRNDSRVTAGSLVRACLPPMEAAA
jgi:hypothetical protein